MEADETERTTRINTIQRVTFRTQLRHSSDSDSDSDDSDVGDREENDKGLMMSARQSRQSRHSKKSSHRSSGRGPEVIEL